MFDFKGGLTRQVPLYFHVVVFDIAFYHGKMPGSVSQTNQGNLKVFSYLNCQNAGQSRKNNNNNKKHGVTVE